MRKKLWYVANDKTGLRVSDFYVSYKKAVELMFDLQEIYRHKEPLEVYCINARKGVIY